MKKINKSRYAILGMLFDKPRSGYEIKSRMLESTEHFWQESDASIYPMLKKLEAEGKVQSKTELAGSRVRNIFEITQAGKNEFTTWMAIPAESAPHRDELLLKLFFGSTMPKEVMINQLQLKLQRYKKKLAIFNIIEIDEFSQVADSNSHKIYWKMTLRNGIILLEAEIKWIEECLKILINKAKQSGIKSGIVDNPSDISLNTKNQ